jgi:hypothetical protein
MPTPLSLAKLTYQIAPIFLTGGIATGIPGSIMPMLSFTNAPVGLNLAGNILPVDIKDLDEAFGAFTVLPSGTLVSQQVAKFPFANQFTAANATIREPLGVQVLMEAPMRGPNAWANKFAIMNALKATLDIHNNLGGTYTILTPAFMYTEMIMTELVDASRATNSLPQNAWKFVFERPLVALEELKAIYYSYNLLMRKLANAVPATPVVTGVQVGSPSAQSPLLQPNLTPMVGGMITASGLGLGFNLGNLPASLAAPVSPGGAMTGGINS